MGWLKDRMEADMKLRNLRHRTQVSYLMYARALAAFHRRSPAEMDEEDVRGYLLHLVEVRKASASTVNVNISALRFLFGVTLGRPEVMRAFKSPKRDWKLPSVLTGTEVEAVLAALDGPRYRAVVTTMYAAGLRVSEACKLRVDDIDSGRMVIHVRDCKGRRDRLVMLSPRLLELLRGYWRVARPKPPYLFAGERGRPVHVDTVRKVLKLAVERSGLTKRVTSHTMRNSFATHLLAAGTDIRTIQALLGHASVISTMRYAQVTDRLINNTQSPLDVLPTEMGRRALG